MKAEVRLVPTMSSLKDFTFAEVSRECSQKQV